MNIYSVLYKLRDIGKICVRPFSNRIQLFNYDAFHRPITCIKEDDKKVRLNLLVMTIEKEAMFGGIATAIKIFRECCSRMEVESRIITLHTPKNYKHDLLSGYTLDKKAYRSIFVAEIDGRNLLPVRERDFFFSSFWVTSLLEDKIYLQQKKFFPDIDIPYFYLVQDYEPAFYAWSSNFMEADSSYFTNQKIVAIINSKELNDYFHDVLKYQFYDSVYFEPRLHDKLREQLFKYKNKQRKKQILIYGRPGEARNAFENTIHIIKKWSNMLNAEDAANWSVISLGSKHTNIKVGNGISIVSKGKVSLEEYANYMLESYAAISLMVSPHPSYPPLEMSTFGVKTITNNFANKNLDGFNKNLIVIDKFSCDKAAQKLYEITSHFEPGISDSHSAYVTDHNELVKVVELVKKYII